MLSFDVQTGMISVRSLGAMMIPAVRWSPSPGSTEKSGSRDSATFMRKVPEPQRQWRMRSAVAAGTAALTVLLREQGQVGLDDPIGRYVDGLHKDLARARIGELLSHSAGVTRDGPDAGQFLDRRPFLSRAELLADLRAKPPLEAGVQLKYSNHGYGLLGLMMEQVTGTDYAT